MQLPALITTDLHLTDAASTEYRWGLFPWLGEKIRKHHVRTICILGDLTDAKDNHSARLVNRVVGAINALPIDDIRILVGNHDWLKKDQEFFRFLSLIPAVEFIFKPTEDTPEHGPSAYFLPYSKNPAKEWKDYDFSHYDMVFMHQTIRGAVASNGQRMEGEDLPNLSSARIIYSGDIHVPQKIGGITYVGSPYHVHFGDNFTPRCILLDHKGLENDLHFPTINRVVVNVRSMRELGRVDLRAGDQVKLRIELPESEKHGWSKLRREAVANLRGRGIDVHGVELIVTKAARRASMGGSPTTAERTPQQALLGFVEREELGSFALDLALEIIES